MGVLTEIEINEFAGSMLDPKTGAPGVVDPNTAYDWCRNAEMVIEQNAIEMGENASPDALRKYVKNEMKKAIKDLGRFNPGEMSVFWVNENDGMHPSQRSTQDIFAQKFGLTSPSPIAGGLKRTMMLGDMVRDQFLRTFSERGFQTTPQAKKNTSALRNKIMELYNSPLETLPWLKPGKVEFLEDVTGETWAVFFKIPPNEDSIQSVVKEIPDGYYAEFGQTVLAMDELGIEVDRLVFAPFNFSEMRFGFIENKKSKNPQFRSSIQEINISPEIKAEIKQIGNKLYNDHLLKVDMPPWNISGNFTNIEQQNVESSLKRDYGRYTYLNTIKNLVTKEAETLKKSMLKSLPSKLGVDTEVEGKVRVGGYIDFNQKEKKKFDTVGAAEYLMEQKGVMKKDLVTDVISEDKVLAMAESMGLTEDITDRFETISYQTTVTIPKNSEYKSVAEDLSAELIQESEGIFSQICGLDAPDDSDMKTGTAKIVDQDAMNKRPETPKSEGKKKEHEDTLGLGGF